MTQLCFFLFDVNSEEDIPGSLRVLSAQGLGRGEVGNCSYLFFECPSAQKIWTKQNIRGWSSPRMRLSRALSGVEYSRGR